MTIEPLEDRIAPAIIVNSLADVSVAGKTTLRDAITTANAATSPDVITFAKGLHGTVKLTGGVLGISYGVTIDGLYNTTANTSKHNAITISGAGTQQIFNITGSGAVTINNLNFTDGMSASIAGAIYSNNTNPNGLTISGCAFTRNIATSTGQTSEVGGAIGIVGGKLNLKFSKLSGNKAIGDPDEKSDAKGGAVFIGGGVFAYLSADAFTSNSALCAARFRGGDARGGAIYSNGALSIVNSTFSGNLAVGGPGNKTSGSAFGGAIYNAGNNTSYVGYTKFIHNSAKGGTGVKALNAAGSPPGATGATGYTGGAGGTAGGGAIAGQFNLTVYYCTLSGNVAIGGSGGKGGKGGSGGGKYGATKAGPGGDGGQGGNAGIAYGGGIAALNTGSAGATNLTVNNSTISGNAATPGKAGKGGAPGAGANASNPPFPGHDGHPAVSSGGGVYIYGAGTLSVGYSTISKNKAEYGGGIKSKFVDTTDINLSTISSNTAIKGGGIESYYHSGTVTIANSTISGNKATTAGGGIYNYGQAVTLNQVTIANNSADSGGGFYGQHGSITVNNSTIAFNKATVSGGGLDVTHVGTTDTFYSTVVADNSVSKSGGGPDISGTISATYSAFGSTAGLTISNSTATNITGQTSGDFFLEALHNSGGTTETILFQETASHTSKLLNAGAAPITLTLDQRGDPRFSPSDKVDIGSVEVA